MSYLMRRPESGIDAAANGIGAVVIFGIVAGAVLVLSTAYHTLAVLVAVWVLNVLGAGIVLTYWQCVAVAVLLAVVHLLGGSSKERS